MTEELKQAALEACPFCGADPQDAHHIEYGRWAVTCRCGAKGASANTGPNATDAAKIKAYSDARIAWNTRALTQRPAVQAGCNHVLYETTDADRPKEICDRNGEVVLAMCKLCSKAEAELETTQPAVQATPEPVGEPDTVPLDALHAAERERDYWKTRARAMLDHAEGTCWYWMGDGEDHLESLVNSLPVVIRADQLRELLARPAPGVPEGEPKLTQEELLEVAKYAWLKARTADSLQFYRTLLAAAQAKKGGA